MHVLLIPSWYPANSEDMNGVFFREQAHALAEAGHRVGVIAPMFRSLRLGARALRPAYDSDIWQDDGPVTVLRAHGTFTSSRVPHFDLWYWCRSGERLFRRYVRDHGRPDILHAHSLILGGVLAERISARTGIPFGVTEHSSTYSRNLIRDWQVPGLRIASQAATFRLAVSQTLADAVETLLGGPKWSVLPNSLTPPFEEDFSPKPRRAAQVPRLVSVGNLNDNKGFDLLLNALAKARSNGVTVRMDIGGDGPLRAELEALSVRLGLSDHVRFLGPLSRENVRKALREADAFALASRHESFGIVFIEAMSQGLPVIATCSGGPGGIVTPQDGILVPTDDTDALVTAIETLSRRLADFDSSEIRRRTLARYSQAALVSQLQAIYADALSVIEA